jgi:D-alanine-D-alanine ligase
VADFRFDDRIEEKMASQSEVHPEPGITETSHVPNPARLCAGTTFDELVQWMVQDASLDRCDRWGPKLT